MLLGTVCLVVSVIALVIAMINGRAANDCLAIPMLIVFAITLVAGVFFIAFDSWIVGAIAIGVMALGLCNLIWP